MNTIDNALTIIAPVFLVIFFFIICFSLLEEKQTIPQGESCGDMYVMEGMYNKLYLEKGQEYAEKSKVYLMLLNRIKACVESQEGYVTQETKNEWEILK